MVLDADASFGIKILSGNHKADTETLRKGVCHPADLLIRQRLQISCSSQLVFRDIFAKPVQIAKIRKIAVHDNR